MNSFLKKLLNVTPSQPTPSGNILARRARPGLEFLERRDLMAAYVDGPGQLVVEGASNGDFATVEQVATTAGSSYRVILNDTVQLFPTSLVRSGKVIFRGYNGADRFDNLTALQTWAYGGEGNDTLSGGAVTDYLYGGGDDELYGRGGNDRLYGEGANDRLHGQGGSDRLFGSTGNDKLFGGTEYDYLYGNEDDDFLDDGSGAEYVEGGDGYDFNAYVTAVAGATYTDVFQGASPTCWVTAAISAAARAGVDMSSRISYLGNGRYRVGLYNPSHVLTQQYVSFDGTRFAADAIPNPGQEGESWVLITQRAILQMGGMNYILPGGGWSECYACPQCRTRLTTDGEQRRARLCCTGCESVYPLVGGKLPILVRNPSAYAAQSYASLHETGHGLGSQLEVLSCPSGSAPGRPAGEHSSASVPPWSITEPTCTLCRTCCGSTSIPIACWTRRAMPRPRSGNTPTSTR
jgi:uncharacterized protein YbaR (Trm112 family)